MRIISRVYDVKSTAFLFSFFVIGVCLGFGRKSKDIVLFWRFGLFGFMELVFFIEFLD